MCQRHRPRQESSKKSVFLSVSTKLLSSSTVRCSYTNRKITTMKNVIRTAIVATMLGAATLGLAGAATAAPVTAPISAAQQGVALPLSPIMAPAAPLNDPNGLCSYHDADGNCSVGAGAPSIID